MEEKEPRDPNGTEAVKEICYLSLKKEEQRIKCKSSRHQQLRLNGRISTAGNHAGRSATRGATASTAASGQGEVGVAVQEGVVGIPDGPAWDLLPVVTRHQGRRRRIPARVHAALGYGGEVGPLRLGWASSALRDVLVRGAGLDGRRRAFMCRLGEPGIDVLEVYVGVGSLVGRWAASAGKLCRGSTLHIKRGRRAR